MIQDDEALPLIPIDFGALADELDRDLARGRADERAYEMGLRGKAAAVAQHVCQQASVVGRLSSEERAWQELFIREIWAVPLDLLMSTVLVSKGAAEWHIAHANQQVRDGQGDQDPRFWPIANITARQLRTGFEVHALCLGGFPKGAVARARSMYELAITSRVLGDHGAPDGRYPALGRRYAQSQQVERYRDAIAYNATVPAAERFPETDLEEWRKGSDDAIQEFGTELGQPRGWAKPLFPDKKGLVQIPDLEELAGFTVHRPFYRWANHEVHATARGGVLNTYVDNDGRFVHSTGRTHRGLAEPMSMAGHYVGQSLTDLLLSTGATPSTVANLTLRSVLNVTGRLDDALVDAHETAESAPYTV